MRRADAIEPFRVMEILARAKALEAQGAHVVHFEIGEPDFPPPDAAIEAAVRALQARRTRYTPAAGLPELREGISRWYRRTYGVEVAPSRILVTPGSSPAFVALFAALLDPGEEVLLPDPGYPCQRNFARIVGAAPKLVPVGPQSRWQLDAEAIAAHWGARTRAAVITNPGNPSGALVDRAFVAEALQAARARGGWLVVDEIYQGLVYGEAKAWSALSISDEVIVVDGFSKRWAMTGMRVGWVVLPSALAAPVERVLQNAVIAAPTEAQYAALAALDADEAVERMRAAYDARRKLLLPALEDIGFRVPCAPEGAFYIYADASRFTDDAEAFCRMVLEQAHVAITPGADFGVHEARRYVRFSYATGLDDIREGIDRLRKILS